MTKLSRLSRNGSGAETESTVFRSHRIKTLIRFFVVALFAATVFPQFNPSSSDQSIEIKSSENIEAATGAANDNATLNLHRWGAVTLFHGLPSDRVNAIAEDASGALWFGTDKGLVRYDGRRTQLVTGEGANALPSSRVRALKLDAGGGLWVGTEAGAARIAGGRMEAVAGTQGRAVRGIAESPEREITLVTDHGEIMRFSAAGANAAKDSVIKRSSPYADPNFGKVIAQKLDPASHWQLRSDDDRNNEKRLTELTSIAFSEKSGEWWIGSQRRGALVNKGSELREAILRAPRPYFVEAIYATGNRVWIGAQAAKESSGLWFEQEGALLQFPLRTGKVTAIHAGNGDLWIGTDEQGAMLLRGERMIEHLTFEDTAGGLRSNHLNTIFRDHEGIVWFGTDRGVCRYDRESFRAATIGGSGEANFIRSLLVTKQGETLAGSNQGLFRLTRGADLGPWAQVAEIPGRAVYALVEDDAGAIWAGTNSGLFVRRNAASDFTPVRADSSLPTEPLNDQPTNLDGSDHSSTRNRDSIRAAVKFRGQIYALVFGRGIERVEGDNRVPVLTGEPWQRAICMAVEPGAPGQPDAALWFGTTDGELMSFDGTATRSRTPNRAGSQQRQAVRAIAFANGRVHVGTMSGVFELDGQSWKQVISDVDVYALLTVREQHLPEVIPQAALGRFVPGRQAVASAESAKREGFTEEAEHPAQPREVIWCGTKNAGLYKLLARDQVAMRFDTEQGLASQQVFAVAADQNADRVWIGTNRGVVLHQPGHIAPRIEARRLVADRVYPQEDLDAEVGLPHTQTNFLLEVAALGSRTFPGQFQYEFTMRNRLGQPVRTLLTSDSQFAIEKLARGPYTVWVRAISRDLVYSEPLQVRFRIPNSPFPWTTVMLTGLLGLAVAAAGYAFIQNRRTARTNRQLAETNEELRETRIRLANETEAERSRIARDLHDQTLGDLRHLLVLTDQMEKASSSHSPASTAPGSQPPTPAVLRREIEAISSEIRHICEDLSPSVLENIGFLPALEWALTDAVAHLPADEKFAYEFRCEPELEDRLELSQIERIQLYRIVQEALNNICRHARATRVTLAVRTEAASDESSVEAEPRRDLLIEVVDDGPGFDGNSSSRTGHGILNIRSRANLIGAQVAWNQVKPGVKSESENGSSGCRFELRKAACVRCEPGQQVM